LSQGARSDEVDAILAALPDWRGATLARVRRLIHEAASGIVEEVKWKKPSNPAGVPGLRPAAGACTPTRPRPRA